MRSRHLIDDLGPKFFDRRAVKKPNREERQRMCTSKRRYRSEGDALDAALLAGVERRRKAYRCPVCGYWHLTSG